MCFYLTGSLLKVDINEKEGGQEGDLNSASVWHCGERFSLKLIIPISGC
jgi:hypothetical protein